MQQLKLNDASEFDVPKNGFWKRQFQTEATDAQKTFDWSFGVILPLICFIFDPAVFKGNFIGTAYLGSYKPFAYILSFATVMALSAFLIWGEKLKRINGFLAGLFAVSGIVSLIIGVVLAPLSLLGLIILIGALGFTPFFSTFVYLRNSSRAYKTAVPLAARWSLRHAALFGVFGSLVLPTVFNARIEKNMNEIVNGDAPTIRAAGQKLKFVAPLVNFDPVALRYRRTSNNEEAAALAELYQKLTGENVESHGLFD